MKDSEDLLKVARNAAYRVSFLITVEEIRLYYNAIYSALLWAKGNSTNQIKNECYV